MPEVYLRVKNLCSKKDFPNRMGGNVCTYKKPLELTPRPRSFRGADGLANPGSAKTPEYVWAGGAMGLKKSPTDKIYLLSLK